MQGIASCSQRSTMKGFLVASKTGEGFSAKILKRIASCSVDNKAFGIKFATVKVVVK